MGREDVTDANPMGFIPPVIVPDEKEAEKILAKGKAELKDRGES